MLSSSEQSCFKQDFLPVAEIFQAQSRNFFVTR
jgi:hypothetical protein